MTALVDAVGGRPEPVCRHGHGPLDGWRARGATRGRYCRACNVEQNRRWWQRHGRAH